MLSDIYRVGFIGHREIDNVISVENKLYPIIQDLIMHAFDLNGKYAEENGNEAD